MSTDYVTTGISMQPADWERVEDAAKQRGDLGRSAMLRVIIREWQSMERLRLIGQAHALGMLSTENALQQVIDAAADMPLAIRLNGDEETE